jgi:hypothetical protein
MPANIYVLDRHDQCYLCRGLDCDLVLVSVFNPPVKGFQRHDVRYPVLPATELRRMSIQERGRGMTSVVAAVDGTVLLAHVAEKSGADPAVFFQVSVRDFDRMQRCAVFVPVLPMREDPLLGSGAQAVRPIACAAS